MVVDLSSSPGRPVRSSHQPRDFSQHLRDARQRAKLSQLALAIRSGVTQRHISFLESGRARPGRDVATRLANVLGLTLLEHNALLNSAGFTASFPHSDPDSPCMQPILRAVSRMLAHHEPYPGLAMDRAYNVLLTNQAFDRLLHEVAPVDELWQRTCGEGTRNLLKLTLHPLGLRSHMEDFASLASGVMERASREAGHCAELAEVLRTVHEYDGMAKVAGSANAITQQGPVFLETYVIGGRRLRLFSVTSTMGAPIDVGAQSLMVECFFPSDSDGEALLGSLAGSSRSAGQGMAATSGLPSGGSSHGG
jgi:transcriptional regulator with XRE-family HTH domain